MNEFEIIEKHLKDASDRLEAAYQKVKLDSATTSDWNEYYRALDVRIAIKALYLELLEHEIREAKILLRRKGSDK